MSSNRTVGLRAAVISAGIVISAVDLVGPVTDGAQGVLVPAHSTLQYSKVHYRLQYWYSNVTSTPTLHCLTWQTLLTRLTSVSSYLLIKICPAHAIMDVPTYI